MPNVSKLFRQAHKPLLIFEEIYGINIRKILKSCPETDRLDILAKVPRCSKRSTCTLADLISLNAVLAA